MLLRLKRCTDINKILNRDTLTLEEVHRLLFVGITDIYGGVASVELQRAEVIRTPS